VSFIVFEGGDKCGKTEMVRRTLERLRSLGLEALELSFPRYDQPTGKLISEFLHGELMLCPGPAAGPSSPDLDTERRLAFEAMQLLDKWSAVADIRAARDRGAFVVSSRWADSALIYGMDNGFSAEWLSSFLDYLPYADLNILLDVGEDVALARLSPEARRDSYERDRAKQLRIRQAYRDLWVRRQGGQGRGGQVFFPQIDASGSRDDVFEAIWKAIVRCFHGRLSEGAHARQ
jgi:dTMP kinase